MELSEQIPFPKQSSHRLQATIWIWSLSVLSMFACVPLLALTQAGVLLPLFVMVAAATSTIAIWLKPYPRNDHQQNQIQQLQQRVEVLESIACRDGLETAKH